MQEVIQLPRRQHIHLIVIHASHMRLTDWNPLMTTDIYFRPDLRLAGDQVNDLFEQLGHGRPISPHDHNGHISAVVIDGRLVGAAYAAAAMSIADTLLLNCRGIDSIVSALRIHAIEALAVLPRYRGHGYGTALLESIATHANEDFHAEHLITRIDEADSFTQQWWSNRQFQVHDESLAVDGLPLGRADGYLEAWRPLTETPRTQLTTAHPALLTTTLGGI